MRRAAAVFSFGVARQVPRYVCRSYFNSSVGSSLIPMVNSLQTVFTQAKQKFDLPQIVVVGAQSSGMFFLEA